MLSSRLVSSPPHPVCEVFDADVWWLVRSRRRKGEIRSAGRITSSRLGWRTSASSYIILQRQAE